MVADNLMLGLDLTSRVKVLAFPTPSFSVNEVVLSTVLRMIELQGVVKDAEKTIDDSSLVKNSVGKRLVFVGDIASISHDSLDSVLTYLTVVGEDYNGNVVSIKESISNLVAEKYTLPLKSASFLALDTKLMAGMTIMFSAKVSQGELGIALEEVRVLDIGLKLLKDDGSVDSLARITSSVPTYSLEYGWVNRGTVMTNKYRNPMFDAHIISFSIDSDRKNLYDASMLLLYSLDDYVFKEMAKLSSLISAK